MLVSVLLSLLQGTPGQCGAAIPVPRVRLGVGLLHASHLCDLPGAFLLRWRRALNLICPLLHLHFSQGTTATSSSSECSEPGLKYQLKEHHRGDWEEFLPTSAGAVRHSSLHPDVSSRTSVSCPLTCSAFFPPAVEGTLCQVQVVLGMASKDPAQFSPHALSFGLQPCPLITRGGCVHTHKKEGAENVGHINKEVVNTVRFPVGSLQIALPVYLKSPHFTNTSKS